jgi:hypothetical protein
MLSRQSTALLSLLAIAGCNSPASIEITPKMPYIGSKNAPLQLKAVVKDSSGKVLSDAKVSFSALTPTIIGVTESGSVVGLHSGNGAVLVRCGDVQKKVEVRVLIAKRLVIEPDNPVLNVGLKNKAFKVTLYDDRGKPMLAAGKVKWTSSDPSVMPIDQNGLGKTLKDGKTTVTAYASGIRGATIVTVSHEKMQKDGYLGQGK